MTRSCRSPCWSAAASLSSPDDAAGTRPIGRTWDLPHANALVLVASLVAMSAAWTSVSGEMSADSAAARTHSDSLSWPLDIRPILTSSFGEYRSGHFHAGVDLSTFGREGESVRAVADGEVVRVRASAVGYGRALYTRLADGRLAVYAHLESFMEPVARYVEERQHRLGRYRVDLYPEAGRFTVRRGQVVGRSGSSGAGGPHLHFELREGDSPINPLTHGLLVPDKKPPVLTALVFTPLEARARVNGEATKAVVRLSPSGARQFTAQSEIEIQGRVGVGVKAYDRAGRRDSRLGLYRAELFVDDIRCFAVRFDRFDYSYNHEVEAEFDYEQAVAGERPALNLHVPAGIVGDYHGGLPPGAGILDAGAVDRAALEPAAPAPVDPPFALEPGPHTLRVVAADANGNAVTASARLRVEAPPVPSPDSRDRPRAASTKHGAPSVHLSSASRVATLEVEFAVAPEVPPALWLAGTHLAGVAEVSPGRYAVRIDARGQGPLEVGTEGADGTAEAFEIDLPWLPVLRHQSGTFAALDGHVEVEFPARAFFEDAYIWVEEEEDTSRLAALPVGLEPVSAAYRIEPEGFPLDRSLWVGIALDEPESKIAGREQVALYHVGRDETSFEGKEERGVATIGGRVRKLGLFVLARDLEPPELRFLAPRDSSIVDGGRPLFRARIRDRQSGLFEDDVTFLIDGRRVPTEWDPDADDMRYRPRTPLASGTHVITARATDRAGLTSVRTVTIEVR